jgi:hypothetical protein
VTIALVPLNSSASPNLPAVDQVAFVIVPLLAFPDASVTVVPDPSSNPYAATRPDGFALTACATDFVEAAGLVLLAVT